MSAIFKIGKEEHKAILDYDFLDATEKYAIKDGDNRQDGFTHILMHILDATPQGFVMFWDTALMHEEDKKPSKQKIKKTIFQAIENGETTFDDMQKVAFDAYDSSGFLKKQWNRFWEGIEKQKEQLEEKKSNDTSEEKTEKTEEEVRRDQQIDALGQLLTTRDNLRKMEHPSKK